MTRIHPLLCSVTRRPAFRTLAVCASLFAPGLLAQKVSVVQTNPDQSALLSPQAPLLFVPGTAPGNAINIDDTIRYQTLEGVGGSFTDSSASLVMNKLTPDQRAALMKDLFSPSGIHLSFLRQPMGATDLALSTYTYDDVASGGSDPNLQQFSIAHDQAYIIPSIKAALAANPRLKVLALPWSPPAWMKTTGTTNGGTVNTANFPALARYFGKFIAAYEANGIPVNYVAVQNEPLNETTGYPSTFMNAHDEGQFIAQYLGPELQNAHFRNAGWNFDGQTTDPADATPGILGYEHNWDNPKYPLSLANDPEVRPYLAGVSFHCYGGNVADGQNAAHNLGHDVPVFFTECTGTSQYSNFAQNLINATEGQVINVLRNWGKTVVFWNLALDPNGGPTVQHGCNNCRGVVTIDDSVAPAVVTKNVEYYVLGHLAKYVQQGAYRIDSNSYGSGNVEDVAFKNPDGSIAVLVFNGASVPRPVSLNWKGKTASYTLPANAVATFYWAGYQAGTFDLTAGPPARTVAVGDSTSFDVNVNRYSNRGAVQLSVTGLPGGVTGAPAPLAPGDNADYLLPLEAMAGANVGTYPVTITGRRGQAEASSTVNLTVGQETPFSAAPISLPGTVQAENFDNGGNAIGYFNLDSTDQGNAPSYRPGTTVGVEQTGDTGGGYDVGYTKEGEYLRYTVNVAQDGVYNLQSRVASLGNGGYYHVSFDGENKTGTLYAPVTGGFQTYTTQVSPSFTLAAGKHVMQVTLDGNGPTGGMGNFNWFAVQAPAPSLPYTGAANTFPGQIQAENFDLGGKSVGYWNGASSNTGGGNYRPGETVAIESSSDTGGGYDIGNAAPGDWLNYTVQVASARAYTLQVRVASGTGGGTFHLNLDGVRVTPSMSVPNTGGWQTWQTLSIPGVNLPAGQHVLQLVVDSGGYYNVLGNVNWIAAN